MQPQIRLKSPHLMSQENTNTITIEEAIKRLKWEIIAQDWSLSLKRIALLEEAFLFLKKHYADRRPARNILIMADSLLHYIKDRGDSAPSESIDFLKEAMAHIVNIYETEDLETEKEEHLFKILYYRFNKLKGKIKSHKTARKPDASPQPEVDSGREELEIDSGDELFDPDRIEEVKEKIYSLQIESEPEDDRLGDDIEYLVNGLQKTLERAEDLTAKIRRTVTELRLLKHSGDLDRGAEESSPIKNCPPTELREIVIEGQPFYIQETAIALISRLSPSRAAAIQEDRSASPKALARPFRRLPRQFKGILGSLTTGELKNIRLPVVVPIGPELPDYPDAGAGKAVVLSKGNRAGILLCSEVAKKTENMIQFQMLKDGDTIGRGFTARGDRLRIINVAPVLKRDGMTVS